jgi:hypothetical protein
MAWNLHHFNGSHSQPILDTIASMLRKIHITLLLEVSRDAPLQILMGARPLHFKCSKLLPMSRTTGFYAVYIWDTRVFGHNISARVEYQDDFERDPVVVTVSLLTDWKFHIIGLNLTPPGNTK